VNETALAIVRRDSRGSRYRKPCGRRPGVHRDMSANNICKVRIVDVERRGVPMV